MAAAPPGSGTGARCPTRSYVAGSRYQELPAPDGAVRAVAGAVERDPDDRPGLAGVGQAGRDERVVVLDPDQVDVG